MNPSLIVKLPLPGGPRRTSPAPEPSSRRPVRSTRTQIATYNNAILAGTALHTPTKYLEKHHKNVLHGPLTSMAPGRPPNTAISSVPSALRQVTTPTLEQAGKGKVRGASGTFLKKTKENMAIFAASPKPFTAAKPVTAPTYSKLPLTSYWDAETWSRFTRTAVVTLSTIIQCLGLAPSQKNTFQNAFAQHLSQDLDALAKALSTLPDLVTCAADPNYLDEELDVILDVYAPEIWGMDADRELLLRPVADSLYKKDLVYEDEEDRKILWMHLHRWVFVRAFEMVRERGGGEDTRKGVLGALGQEEPRMGRKRKVPAPSDPLTTAFLAYLNGRGAPALHNIKRALYNTAASPPHVLKDQPHTHNFPHILAAWLTYQSIILDVLDSHAETPFPPLSPLTLKIKNSRLLTELRKARDEFITSDSDAEGVLVEGFDALQRTVMEGQRAGREVSGGLERFERELVRLGDELKEGGGEWVVMGPSGCPIVLVKKEEE